MKSDMEDKDWLDDDMSLKQVNPNNPFTVPASYFDEMGKQLTSYINLHELGAGNADGFAVPENYFDGLSAGIESRINIEELANGKNTGFATPENYFENLQQQINARILVEEALAETSAEFTVPADYFDRLNKNILNKTVNADIVKRKGVVRRLFASASFQYAAAACFALVIGSGIFISQVTDPVTMHKNTFLHKQLSAVPLGDIQSYLQINDDAGETQHTAEANGETVNGASLSDALQEDVDTNQ
jgi:hypothetical protein